jgi:hypothetical protein
MRIFWTIGLLVALGACEAAPDVDAPLLAQDKSPNYIKGYREACEQAKRAAAAGIIGTSPDTPGIAETEYEQGYQAGYVTCGSEAAAAAGL